jgi:hypothetical protein
VGEWLENGRKAYAVGTVAWAALRWRLRPQQLPSKLPSLRSSGDARSGPLMSRLALEPRVLISFIRRRVAGDGRWAKGEGRRDSPPPLARSHDPSPPSAPHWLFGPRFVGLASFERAGEASEIPWSLSFLLFYGALAQSSATFAVSTAAAFLP